MAEMEFFDVKSKSKFKTGSFRIEQKKGRYFAVAKSPSGSHECWRIVSKDKVADLKK
jgi:hypothetical protein